MARNGFALTTSAEIALSAATAKTVLQLVAPANTILVVKEITVGFDGISNTAAPVQVILERQTTAGTMTSRTPLKTKDTSTALAATGQENASAEPTGGDRLLAMEIHPQAGAVIVPDGEIEVAGGARVGLVLTAPAGVNCHATIRGEE